MMRRDGTSSTRDVSGDYPSKRLLREIIPALLVGAYNVGSDFGMERPRKASSLLHHAPTHCFPSALPAHIPHFS